MTSEDYDKLSNTEIRLAISKVVLPDSIEGKWKDDPMELIPDYPNDLNAMREAVLRMPADNHRRWVMILEDILGITTSVADEGWDREHCFALATATAVQIAKAFVLATAGD